MKLKRLLLATALAFSFSVTLPGVAQADPITAAIVGGMALTGTAAAVATFVINSALYAASSWATSKLLGGKQKASVQERQAQVTTLSLGEVPREVIIGMACVGGSLVDVWNWGGKYGTDNVTRCIALADHAVEGLYGYYVDDVFYPFTASGVQPGFNGTLTIQFVNGSADGSPPPSMALAAGWAAGDRMTGVTHVWVTTKFDDKVWTQGHPRFRWVAHGLRCFDPRIPSHVWSERSTHSFTRNPALIRHALARGVYVEGRQGQLEHLLVGRGLTEAEAPTARLLASANLCDEQVEGLSRYYTDGVIGADMDFITVEEMFASAMAGVIVQHEGGVEVEPGQAKAAVVTITDADLVTGEAATFSHFLPDNDGGRINTVVPRYVEPAQNWADHSGPVRRDLADIAADGGPRELTLNLPLVTGGAVADRNAEITRRMARLERRAVIVLPAEYSNLEEGDWIAWKSDRYHKGQTVRYRIESWSVDERWRTYLTLREIASSVFGVPDPIEDKAEPPAPPVPVDALVLGGVTVEAITLAAPLTEPVEGAEPATGSAVPAVRFTWDVTTPLDAAVRAIRAEVRVQGTVQATPTRTEDVGLGVLVTTNGVGPRQVLEARLVPIGEPWRPVLPSDWVTVTTGDLIAGGLADAALDKIIEDVSGQIDGDIAAGKEALDRSRANALLILQNAKNALDGTLKEEKDRETQTGDLQDRLDISFLIDPIAKTGIIRSEVKVEGLNETLVQVNTRLVARDADNELQTAQVAIDAQAYTNNKISLATANLVAAAQMAAAISAAVLSMEAYADNEIAQATAGLVAVAQMNTAISASSLALQSWTTGQISAATAGLATTAALANAIAAADLALRSWTDGQISTATAGLAAVSQVDAKIDSATLQIEAWTNGQIGNATATLATKSELDGVSATAGLAINTATTADGKINAAINLLLNVDGLISGVFSYNDGVTATINFLSSAFNLYSTGSGAQTSYIDGVWYVLDPDLGTRTMWGKPFGGGDKLQWWTGPNSVPIFGETKANAYVFISMTAPRIGGSDFPGGSALAATPSPDLALGSAPGGGIVTSDTVTINVTGPGAASAVVRWVKTEETGGTMEVYPSGKTAYFRGTVPPGGLIRALYLAVVSYGGSSVTVLVDVQLTDST